MFQPFRWEDELDRIEFPDGNYVAILRQMSHWDEQRYASGLMKLQPRLGALVPKEGVVSEESILRSTDAQLLLAELDMLLMEICIKDWSFVGRDGQTKASIDRYHLERLSSEVAVKVCEEIRARQPAPKVPRRK